MTEVEVLKTVAWNDAVRIAFRLSDNHPDNRYSVRWDKSERKWVVSLVIMVAEKP